MNSTYQSAIDATTPHPKVSKRYKFVSTRDALTALESQGFQASHVRSRVAFGMHTVTLTHPDLKPVIIGGSEVRPQVILRNSHDTSAAFGLIAGAYRFACFNGLVLGHGFAVRLVHTGNIQLDVKQAMPQVFDTIQAGIKRMHDWSQLQLSTTQVRALAATSLDLRFDDKQLLTLDVSDATETLIKATRSADASNDLFTVYNRIQERLVRGGWVARFDAGVKGIEIKAVRKLYGMRSTLAVNQALSNRTELLYNQLTKEV